MIIELGLSPDQSRQINCLPAGRGFWRRTGAPAPAVLAALAIVLIGCATMTVPETKARTAQSYKHRAETPDLVVAVHPVTDEKELEETFRTNLREKGIVPVLVVVENRGISGSFILSRDKVFVVHTETGAVGGTERRGAGADKSGANVGLAGGALIAVAVVAAPAAIIIGAPLVLAGAKMMSNADVIQHNLADKELYSRTIEPGGRAYGYVYFELAKGEPFEGKHRVLVEVVSVRTGEPVTFDFLIQ